MLIVGGLDIGNRLDINPRMLLALQNSDIVLVENKVMFDRLCADLKISPSGNIIEYYSPMDESEELAVISKVIEALSDNHSVLICPDDGMASIADPGGKLISIARKLGYDISVIPGPSIISTLPAIFGIGGKSFIFEDDIPGTDSELINSKLYWVKESKLPYMFLFKNRRDHNVLLIDILKNIQEIFGERRLIGVGINVTMQNEKILLGHPSKIIKDVSSLDITQQDFISVVVDGQYE